jgi:signal transduction histidine kinase
MPIYLVQPSGTSRGAPPDALGGDVVVVPGLEALADLEAREPGPILVDERVDDAAGVLELVRRVSAADLAWSLVLLGPDRQEARSLSLGPPVPLGDVRAFADQPGGSPGSLLELRGVLREISRVRHDVNNPLTSALAETQLLLLDVEDEETRRSLEVIQEQLRRIRDLVASTKHLRPARP